MEKDWTEKETSLRNQFTRERDQVASSKQVLEHLDNSIY